jgi:gliding motility-associated-like protein
MCRNNLILLTGLLLCQYCLAQQNNVWYFGKKAAITFNPVAGQNPPSALPSSVMDADEGSATICDTDGNLLFYTNGLTVYNKNHQVLLNGNGLMANISTMQSSMVVPLPGSETIFYLFTADASENQFANGYQYSVIDMTGDNGNGEVINKNIVLSASGTERMTAIRHADGISVWLITNDNNSNVFKAWLINCQGLQPNPVVSVVGASMDQYPLMNTGMLKASPDGKKICQTHFPFFDEIVKPPNFFQLFDFNNGTGVLSNAQTIGFPTSRYTVCEFSPDSKLLYVAMSYEKRIDQFEISLPTTAAIIASRFTFGTGNAIFFGMQAGPDQKIYLSQPPSWFLGVINNPNTKGIGCNFQEEQVDVRPGSTYAGLPSFINDLSFSPVNNINYTILDSCTGSVQFNGVSAMSGSLQFEWDFGDGNTSNLQNPVHVYTPSRQWYTVKLKITSSNGCGLIKLSKKIIPSGVIPKIDFNFFGGCDSGYIRLVNNNPLPEGGSIGQYTWHFGDGNSSTDISPTHFYSRPDFYPIKLKYTSTTPCLNDSLTQIVNMKTLQGVITTSGDKTIFNGQTIQLFANGPGTTYQWTPSTALNNPFTARPLASPAADITYKVTISRPGGCNAEDSVRIKVVELDDVYVPTGFTPNNDGKNDWLAPIIGSKFSLKEFSIYSRWGEKVFSTNQHNEGWNGRINGIDQNPGAYVWILKFVTGTGSVIERKGTSILIR